MQPRDTFEHSGAPETSFHAATHELRCRTDIQRSQAGEDHRPIHHGGGPPRGSPHGDPQEDPCRRCSGRQNVPQEERHLHSLKVKQREVGYRTCWLDARPGPAWRNRPLQAEREGADVCTYLQRSGTQRTLLQGHPDGGDQPAKGPDAAADRTGLVAGEVRSVD